MARRLASPIDWISAVTKVTRASKKSIWDCRCRSCALSTALVALFAWGGGGRERRAGTENRVSGSIRGENIVREGVPNGVRGDEEQKAVGVMTGHEGTGKTVNRQFPLR
jgi:hypothetical protein